MGRNASAISARGMREALQLPLHALEEDPLLGVGVLVGVDDVAVVPVEEVGDSGHQPLLVGAGEEQDGGDAFRVHHGESTRLYDTGRPGSGEWTSLSHVHRLGYTSFAMASPIELYDTTLRDGTQMEGISPVRRGQAEDRPQAGRARRALHRGRLARLQPQGRGVLRAGAASWLRNAQLAAFGSTRRAGRHRRRRTRTCGRSSTPARPSSRSSARRSDRQVHEDPGDDARGEPGDDRATPSAS